MSVLCQSTVTLCPYAYKYTNKQKHKNTHSQREMPCTWEVMTVDDSEEEGTAPKQSSKEAVAATHTVEEVSSHGGHQGRHGNPVGVQHGQEEPDRMGKRRRRSSGPMGADATQAVIEPFPQQQGNAPAFPCSGLDSDAVQVGLLNEL